MNSEVLRQLSDATGQQRDLNLARACIALVEFELFDGLCFSMVM
jgi:hypothetical protein